MKTEFARVAPAAATILHASGGLGLGRSALSGLLLLIGALIFVVRPVSHRSPTIDILGSYFPAWMICIVSGLTLTLVADGSFERAISKPYVVSGAAHLYVPDDHLHVCDVDHVLSKLKRLMSKAIYHVGS